MPSRPVYRVAAAGLDPRDVRLIEIVFKHSQYNRYEFVFEPRLVPETVDILIVNPVESDGLRAIARVRTLGRDLPVISALPRGATSSARHAISIDRLTLQLLPILNRVVEMELLPPGGRPAKPDDAAHRSGEPAAPEAAPPPVPAAPRGDTSGAAPHAPARDLPDAGAHAPTRDFLRAAGRVSREGDKARDAAGGGVAAAAHEAAAAVAGAPSDVAGAAAGAAGLAASVAAPAAPPQAAGPPGSTRAGVSRSGPEPAAAPSNLVAFPLSPDATLPRVRVLVVDDSPTVRKQLSLAFSRMNVGCDTAASAAEALQRLAEHHYDLVLVDVVMPDVDGYKLTRQIRRGHRGTPVIILTSRSSPFDLARGALAGCSSYLVKPVPLRQLEAAIVKQLRRSLAIDELAGLIRLSGDAPGAGRRTPPAGGRDAEGAGPQPPQAAGK